MCTLEEMDWPTVFTAAGTGVLVAFLTPRFQHVVWKKQRLREQRIDVAERLAKTGFTPAMLTPTASAEYLAGYLEQAALGVLIQVLFDRPETLHAATLYKNALDVPPPTSQQQFENLFALRVHLLSSVFAEAFNISTDKLVERARESSS